MTDPTVVFDIVHAELSLHELIDLFRQGFAMAHDLFCTLPFTSCT